MLCGGDEYGRTQRGNNNAYCQDNEISWTTWERTPDQERQAEFVAGLAKLREKHPIFRRPKFFQGRKLRGSDVKDILWLNPGGTEMNDEEWDTHFVKSVGVLLNGDAIDVHDWHGNPIRDDTFLLLLNASHDPVDFVLPGSGNHGWAKVLDTRDESGFIAGGEPLAPEASLRLADRSLVVLRRIT